MIRILLEYTNFEVTVLNTVAEVVKTFETHQKNAESLDDFLYFEQVANGYLLTDPRQVADGFSRNDRTLRSFDFASY